MPTFKKKYRGLKKPKDVKKLLSQLKLTGKKTRKKKKPKSKLSNMKRIKKKPKSTSKSKPKSQRMSKHVSKRVSKRVSKPKHKPKISSEDILVKQPSKNMLRLNVYPQMEKPMVTQTEDPHYQSYSFSDAQSSYYMTGQEPHYQRRAQEETNIDGDIKGKLLVDDNGKMYMMDY